MKGSGTKQYVQWVLRRFTEDGCMQSAASLSFTSLLALTPVLAITFAILSAFPAFEGMADRIESIIFNSFVPAAGETVRTGDAILLRHRDRSGDRTAGAGTEASHCGSQHDVPV